MNLFISFFYIINFMYFSVLGCVFLLVIIFKNLTWSLIDELRVLITVSLYNKG